MDLWERSSDHSEKGEVTFVGSSMSHSAGHITVCLGPFPDPTPVRTCVGRGGGGGALPEHQVIPLHPAACPRIPLSHDTI